MASAMPDNKPDAIQSVCEARAYVLAFEWLEPFRTIEDPYFQWDMYIFQTALVLNVVGPLKFNNETEHRKFDNEKEKNMKEHNDDPVNIKE